VEEVDLRDVRTVLKPGDLLVLYTDGITEHRRGNGELLGDDRLVTALADAAPASAEAALQALRAAITSFEPSPPRDDIAMLAIRVEGEQITAAPPQGRSDAVEAVASAYSVSRGR
jgi:serine phosphatase RsbU (regulator of sigma subunit)